MATTVHQKIRIYDLAKELKLDNKKVMEDARREGIEVSVPSNTVPHEVAERIRLKYFPKKAAPKAGPRLVKHAKVVEPVEAPPEIAAAEAAPEPEVIQEPAATVEPRRARHSQTQGASAQGRAKTATINRGAGDPGSGSRGDRSSRCAASGVDRSAVNHSERGAESSFFICHQNIEPDAWRSTGARAGRAGRRFASHRCRRRSSY